jgi:hypothetical protein
MSKEQCDNCEYQKVCFAPLMWKMMLMNTHCGQGRKKKTPSYFITKPVRHVDGD